jgi:hypothetical protein
MNNHAPIFTACRRLQVSTHSPTQRYSQRGATFGGSVERLGNPGRVAGSFNAVKTSQIPTVTAEVQPIFPEADRHASLRVRIKKKQQHYRYFDDTASHIARHA